MINLKAVLCFYLLAISSMCVVAQEETFTQTEDEPSETYIDETVEISNAPLQPSPYANVVYHFPASPERKFVVADPEPIEVLVAFHNGGERVFNVTGVQASLVYPHDYRYIQNYTRFFYHTLVQPHHQQSFQYKFIPDAGLDARNFTLFITVFYHDLSGGNYSTTFFNDTISLVDSPNSVDARTFFTIIGVLGAIGVGSFIAYQQYFSPQGKKSRARKIETGTRTNIPVDRNEWLAGTSATTKKTSVSSPRTRREK